VFSGDPLYTVHYAIIS